MNFRLIGTLFFSIPAVLFISATVSLAQSVSQQSCRFESQIIDLADRIITERPDLPRFTPSRFGAEAAYLSLRYNDMTTPQAFALFSRIKADGARPPGQLSELEMAFAVSRLGVQQGLSINGADPIEAFVKAGLSVMRAIILADGGQNYFDLLSKVRENPALLDILGQRYAGSRVPVVIFDQSDAFKLNFAQLAETNNEIALAGFVLASRADLAEYARFLDRYSDDEIITDLTGERWMFQLGLTVLEQDGPTELRRQLSVADRAQKQTLFDIFKAGMLNREYDILNPMLNQTGRIDEVGRVAQRYLAALASGQISPNDDPETVWLFIHRALIEELGIGTALSVLSTFDLPGSMRHYAGNALQTMDWVVAKAEFAEYVRGETKLLPLRPTILSENLDWNAWIRLARLVRGTREQIEKPLDESDAQIVVELLYLRDKIDMAISLAYRHMPAGSIVNVNRDFMKRLDLRCAGYTDFPGKAVMLGGETLFRFPPAP